MAAGPSFDDTGESEGTEGTNLDFKTQDMTTYNLLVVQRIQLVQEGQLSVSFSCF